MPVRGPCGAVDERVLGKWFAFEMGSTAKALVTSSRPLMELLDENPPQLLTRGGEPHFIPRGVLERFRAALSPLDRRRLRLPVTFYVDKDFATDAALQDETAIRLVFALGEVPAGREAREGKLWLSHAQAQAIAGKHPGAFQFLYT